jgi:hypothetical protein
MSQQKVGLTEVGKTKADVTGDVQGLRYAIINYLNEKGESTVQELSDGTNTNGAEVRNKVSQLVREHWLTWIDYGNDDWDMN